MQSQKCSSLNITRHPCMFPRLSLPLSLMSLPHTPLNINRLVRSSYSVVLSFILSLCPRCSKLENILLHRDPATSCLVAKLTDFGLHKVPVWVFAATYLIA